MSDTTAPAASRIGATTALLLIYLSMLFIPEVVGFVQGRITRHQYDTQAKLFNELEFEDQTFEMLGNGPMVRIQAPGKPIHGWEDAAIGYWIQKHIDGKSPLYNCQTVPNLMVMVCEVHRVVRR